jgi:hypothetical protein
MISPIFRNDPVEIVVPNSKYRQCVAVEKSKIYASVANRLHLSRYQGRRKAALGHLLDLKREIKLITIRPPGACAACGASASAVYVKTRHDALVSRCPLFPQKRMFSNAILRSASCHFRTYAILGCVTRLRAGELRTRHESRHQESLHPSGSSMPSRNPPF